MLAQALIFIFNYETFSKTYSSSELNWDSGSKICYWCIKAEDVSSLCAELFPLIQEIWACFTVGISFQGLIKMNAQVASDHFYSTMLLTKWKVGVIKPWNCNYPLGSAQQLCFRMFPIWIQCLLQQRRKAAVQRWACVCLRIDKLAFAEEFASCMFKMENLTSEFFYQVTVYFMYFILLLCTVTANHK